MKISPNFSAKINKNFNFLSEKLELLQSGFLARKFNLLHTNFRTKKMYQKKNS